MQVVLNCFFYVGALNETVGYGTRVARFLHKATLAKTYCVDTQMAKRQKTTASPPLRAWPRALAAMMKRDAAAPFHPCHPFPFSSHSSDVALSSDRLTVGKHSDGDWAWVRSERGVGAGCGVVRWALQLGKEGTWHVFKVGVASNTFRGYTEGSPKQSWYFSDNRMFADGQHQGYCFDSPAFAAGDVLTVELERAPGVDGVLRVREAGKTPRELRGLPSDGMLCPIVCLGNKKQSYTKVALP